MAPAGPPSAVTGSVAVMREALAAFRYRNFALFWTGALLSNTGTWIQGVTVPYVVFELTGSALWLGVAGSPWRCGPPGRRGCARSRRSWP
jgi:hypothetical protein